MTQCSLVSGCMLSYTDNQNVNLHQCENFKTLCVMDRSNIQALATIPFRRANMYFLLTMRLFIH